MPPLPRGFYAWEAWNWLFCGLLFFYVVWFFVPPVVWFFWGAIKSISFEAGMEGEDDCPIDPAIFQQFLDLGHQPLGTIRVRYWLILEGWNVKNVDRIYRDGDGQWFASIHASCPDEPPSITLFTVFQGEGVLGTTNEGEGRWEVDGTVIQAILTMNVAELQTAHQEKVSELATRGKHWEDHTVLAQAAAYYARPQRLPWPFRLRLALEHGAGPAFFLILLAVMVWQLGYDPYLMLMPMVCLIFIAFLYRWERRQAHSRQRRRAFQRKYAQETGTETPENSPDA